MSKKTIIKRIAVIGGILLVAVGMFVGGMMLTERYKTTIVNTYNKYYDKYYDKAQGYFNQIYDEIHHDIELASQNKDRR